MKLFHKCPYWFVSNSSLFLTLYCCTQGLMPIVTMHLESGRAKKQDLKRVFFLPDSFVMSWLKINHFVLQWK